MIYTVILLSLLSFSVKMTVSPRLAGGHWNASVRMEAVKLLDAMVVHDPQLCARALASKMPY